VNLAQVDLQTADPSEISDLHTDHCPLLLTGACHRLTFIKVMKPRELTAQVSEGVSTAFY
jgi:hypothetical protein